MISPSSRPQDFFANWKPISRRLRECRRSVLFLDFDGTLVPIARSPVAVRLGTLLRKTLRELSKIERLRVCLLSGRETMALQRLVRIPAFEYLGDYGAGKHAAKRISRRTLAMLRRVRPHLRSELAHWPGAWLETKRYSLSVHFKGVRANRRSALLHRLHRISFPGKPQFRWVDNLLDAELIPRALGDKGQNVLRYLRHLRPPPDLLLSFGDDFSDEPVFSALNSGVSVLVGSRPGTCANYRVRSPVGVRRALERIRKELQ